MKMTRRDLTFLLPLLAAADASAQSSPTPSKTYDYATLDVRVNGANKQRFFFDASTHTGFTVRVHETELAPNQMPHASHHHVHEEMLFLREGTMEITIEGKKSRLGPGGVVYVASNEEHGWQNVGTTPARYFIVALGGGGQGLRRGQLFRVAGVVWLVAAKRRPTNPPARVGAQRAAPKTHCSASRPRMPTGRNSEKREAGGEERARSAAACPTCAAVTARYRAAPVRARARRLMPAALFR